MVNDFQFDRIQRHLEGCLLQSGVFERRVEGRSSLMLRSWRSTPRLGCLWRQESRNRSRASLSNPTVGIATIPMQIAPQGQASILLLVRPRPSSDSGNRGRFVTEFSLDVGEIELSQGSYIRVDNIESPAIRQIRWELDPVEGYKCPVEPWLRRWKEIVGCNPAHPPSHWHINSPPIQEPGRRGETRVVTPPELRIAGGLPNPLLLLLSIANWLKSMK